MPKLMRRLVGIIAVLGLVVWGGGRVEADLISNGSFELGTSQPGGNGISIPAGATTLQDWTVFGGNSNDGLGWLSNSNTFGVSTPFGNDFLDLTGYHDQAPFFGVSQTIATVANQSYVLTFDLGVDNNNPLYSGPIGVTASAGETSSTFKDYNPTGSGNVWQEFTLTFTATSGSTLISIQGIQGDQYIGLDNISVNLMTGTVPEPSSLALCGIAGAIGLGIGRLRRRRASLRLG